MPMKECWWLDLLNIFFYYYQPPTHSVAVGHPLPVSIFHSWKTACLDHLKRKKQPKQFENFAEVELRSPDGSAIFPSNVTL